MYCDFDCPALNHKMFVLESSSSDVWDSNYTMKAQLDNFDMGLAIDGTYFQHSTGLYQIYSCWYAKYTSWPSNLCIIKSPHRSVPTLHIRLTTHQCPTHTPSPQPPRNAPSFLFPTNPGRRHPTTAPSTSDSPPTKAQNNSPTPPPTKPSLSTRPRGATIVTTV